jgi:integrase
MTILTKTKPLDVVERIRADSTTLHLDPELSVGIRENLSGLWSATVTWADAVSCVLRERTRGTIEAESELFERKHGKRRIRTGKTLRADAIEWARQELCATYLRLREKGDLRSGPDFIAAGGLTWREAASIILKRKLHRSGKDGRCSPSQVKKYERILATVAAVWDADLLVEATSQSHVNTYRDARMGEHLEWERDARGNIVLEDGKRIPKRGPDRKGKLGKKITPFAIVFPKALKRRNLPPVEEVTVTSDLKDLKTLLSRLMEETDDKARPFLLRNPLDGKNLGRFDKRKLDPATVERYTWTMRFADRATALMAAKYTHHVYVDGLFRCVLALAFHTGHRISAICALRLDDLLFDRASIRRAIGKLKVKKKTEQKPSRDWAEHWPNGAIRWRTENDKEEYDRVIPINAVLLAELQRFLRFRRASGIQSEWLFPRPLDPDTHLLDFDARDLLYVAEGLARETIAAEGLDADELIPVLEDRAFHAYRALWENLRDDLGWQRNRNVAYAGGWTTEIGGSQQVSYNRVKPYYLQAVVDGKSVQDVIGDSIETQRARAAIQTPIPDHREPSTDEQAA